MSWVKTADRQQNTIRGMHPGMEYVCVPRGCEEQPAGLGGWEHEPCCRPSLGSLSLECSRCRSDGARRNRTVVLRGMLDPDRAVQTIAEGIFERYTLV